MNPSDPNSGQRPADQFSTTHWSVVLAAGDGDSTQAQAALNRLCQAYWYPLYAFVRRQGQTAEDAQDLTQAFFARFLERKYVELADQDRGKFRTFLLTSLQHFLINEWEKARAEKRGGFHKVISLDEQVAEQRYLAELTDGLTPDKIFDRRWALRLLEAALARLREEFAEPGPRRLFETLKHSLWGEKGEASYREMAAQLGMTEGALKVAAHRLRLRFRELLRAEVAETVASQAQVDKELEYLISVLRG